MIKFTKNFYQKGVRKKVISLGLDSGSSITKAVLFKDDHIIKTKMIPTSISPRQSMIKDKDNKGDKIHDGNCSNRRCIYRY